MTDLRLRQRFPRFKEGEVVALTKDAIRKHIKGRGSVYGIVVGSGRAGRFSVRVRRLDQRTATRYHVTFWRHTTRAEMHRWSRLPVMPLSGIPERGVKE
jgi:hypothetical protein